MGSVPPGATFPILGSACSLSGLQRIISACSLSDCTSPSTNSCGSLPVFFTTNLMVSPRRTVMAAGRETTLSAPQRAPAPNRKNQYSKPETQARDESRFLRLDTGGACVIRRGPVLARPFDADIGREPAAELGAP